MVFELHNIYHIDQQTAIFANDIRYTQNLSIAKNRKCRLKIIPPNSYEILNHKDQTLEIPPSRGTRITLDSPIIFDQVIGITDTIIFNGKGVPFEDTIPPKKLRTNASIVLKNDSGQTRTVIITKKTGKVST